MWEPTNGAYLFGINIKTLKRSSNLEVMFYGFLREKKHIWVNLKKKVWSIHGTLLLTQYIVIVFVNNFEPSLILVNINKLKPYT
jgi:hypothetical protein